MKKKVKRISGFWASIRESDGKAHLVTTVAGDAALDSLRDSGTWSEYFRGGNIYGPFSVRLKQTPDAQLL